MRDGKYFFSIREKITIKFWEVEISFGESIASNNVELGKL